MLKRFSEIGMNDVSICGGKGASLGEMKNAGFPIPDGFVLTTKAFGKKSSLREKQVLEAFDKLNAKFVAVRSSGTKEDGADDSFAGQFDTYLFVTRDTLIQKIKECHESVKTERILSYCKYKGIDNDSIKVAVVVQKMINSDCAGVCFTVNPISGERDEVMIEAGYGVGEAVVSGIITPDNYIVNKKTKVVEKTISKQEKKLVLGKKGGTEEVLVSEKEQEKQKLSDKHIQNLAKLAIKIEKHYGKPMDTEWAVEDGELFMLQARPITTLGENIYKKAKNSIIYDDIKLRIGDKVFTPELWVKNNYMFNYQGYPFFESIFSKGYSLDDDRWNAPVYYLNGYTLDNKNIAYVAGNGLEKGFNMIRSLLNQETCVFDYFELQDQEVNKCFDYCDNYIKNKYDDFSSIWPYISQTFSKASYSLHNFSYALEKYLQKIKDEDPDLFNSISSNIVCEGETFISQAGEYLISLIKKYGNDFGRVYDDFIKKYYWFQNSYSGITTITTDWLKNYYNELLKSGGNNKKSENSRLTLNKKYRRLANFASKAIIYADNKKKQGIISMTIMQQRGEKIAKKIGIPFSDLSLLSVEEIMNYGINSDINREDLNNKINVYKKNGGRRGLWTNKGYVDVSKEFWDTVVKINTIECAKDIIKGYIGNRGKYVGNIKIISNVETDSNKLKKGDILVTGMTRPEFVPLMQKAGAIITDEGGITCHAAIVSRELGKPCVIGTKNATQMLNDGDLVEVDANNGLIKIL